MKQFLLIVILFSSIATLKGQPPLGWAQSYTSNKGSVIGRSVAVDASGNVYSAGTFNDTAKFNPGGSTTLVPLGINSVYITKHNPSGTLQWAKPISSPKSVIIQSLVADAAGNTYVSGIFSDNSAGGWDIFILKMDANGNVVWDKRLGGSGDDGYASLTLDGASNVYATGWFSKTVDFDPGPNTFNLNAANGIYDMYVLKLDATGNFAWAKQVTGNGYETGNAIALDAVGNIYTTGTFRDTADFDPGPGIFTLIDTSGTGGFISKLDASGNFLWAKLIDSPQSKTIVVDAAGNAYCGAANYVYKFGASGSILWKKNWDITNGVNFTDIGQLAIDAAGDLYIIGKYRGVVDFDWGSASSISSSGAALSETFLVKFDANGNILWVEIFKGWGEGKAISIDASGIYITGLFYNGMDADPGTGTQTLSSGAYAGAFVIKLTQQILPLRLISFAVTPFSDKIIRLNWKTVLENNTQKFVIERSINGIEFSQIGSVKTKGNENQAIENNYAFDDDISRLSTSLPYLWYRLKMMDKDGKFTYSKTIMIKLYRSEIHFSVYPNPAVDFMYINVASTLQETKTAIVQISDATGKIVKQQKAVLTHNAPCFIDVHTLPAGSYIVSLIGKENFNAKVILVK